MSTIHGPQYLLPLFLEKGKKESPFKDNEEITLAFYLLTKNFTPSTKLISFSRLLWPLLSIQGVIGRHIFLDGLYILKKEGKFTNPPRQPLIGHLLRNIDNRTQLEQLNKIIEVLTYEDTEAEEIGKGEESEYRALTIGGLVHPEFLNALSDVLNLIEYQPINEYMPLDTTMSIEKALDLAEKYRNTIGDMKGNAQRWEMQIDLIQKEIDKMMIDITVNIKDTMIRYDSQVKKITSALNNEQMQDQIEREIDKIDLWKMNEKKNLIENFTLSFKNTELLLEEIIKKNKFFSNSEVLKTKPVEDLISNVNNHIDYLKSDAQTFEQSINSIEEKFQDFKNRLDEIEKESNEKINSFKEQLDMELQAKSKQVMGLKNEKVDLMNSLNSLKQQIEDLTKNVNQIIFQKKSDCLKEAEDLKSWSIDDEQSELFSRPIQWIYMPLYVLFYEDEEMLEEKMDLVFPGFINSDSSSIYENFSEEFATLKQEVLKKIEEDMILRSNFEFSCENKNYLKDSNLPKKIQQGLSNLRYFINNDQENKIREKISSISI